MAEGEGPQRADGGKRHVVGVLGGGARPRREPLPRSGDVGDGTLGHSPGAPGPVVPPPSDSSSLPPRPALAPTPPTRRAPGAPLADRARPAGTAGLFQTKLLLADTKEKAQPSTNKNSGPKPARYRRPTHTSWLACFSPLRPSQAIERRSRAAPRPGSRPSRARAAFAGASGSRWQPSYRQ